ncbi:MAG TPA: hypothetical protein VFV68_00265, partial [Agriterribacter sp.]|nr:hypothetical protein [Agriterribacter sp.]
MKRFFLLLLILPILMPVLAQEQAATIELDVKGEKKAPVSFTVPVNHTVFWGSVKEDSLRNGKYKIVLNASQTGFVQVLILDYTVRLFVQQGDHLRVTIDESNTEQPISIAGNNHTGQEVFTSMELGYPGNMVGRYRRDSTAVLLETHIEADKQVRLNIFNILFDEKKIDK